MIARPKGDGLEVPEQGHRTKVEAERCRVVCLACTWFKYDPHAAKSDLMNAGRQHVYATKER